MSARWALRMLIVAAACVIGFVAGYRLAVPECACPDCPDSDAQSAPGQSGRAVMRPDAAHPHSVLSASGPACDPGELVRARKTLQRLKLAEDLSRKMPAYRRPDAAGSSDEWDEAPYQYREEGFRQVAVQAAQELEDRTELVGVDCREMPCMAILLAGTSEEPPRSILETQAWKKHFGTGGRKYNALIDCRDGRKERIEIASPFWDGRHDPLQMDPEDIARVVEEALRNRTGEEQQRETVRLANRWRAIRDWWICRPPDGPED